MLSQWVPCGVNSLEAGTLPNGTNLTRKDWVTLNRAHAKVGKNKYNLHRWGLANNPECPCEVQTMNHLLWECPKGPHCTDQDLREASENAIQWVCFYHDKIWWFRSLYLCLTSLYGGAVDTVSARHLSGWGSRQAQAEKFLVHMVQLLSPLDQWGWERGGGGRFQLYL